MGSQGIQLVQLWSFWMGREKLRECTTYFPDVFLPGHFLGMVGGLVKGTVLVLLISWMTVVA